jgi:hypothetical protein
MTNTRYREICLNKNAVLTKEELAEGWHFCPDWDYMLLDGNPYSECQTCPIDCASKDIWREKNKITLVIDFVFQWLSERPLPVSVPILKAQTDDN